MEESAAEDTTAEETVVEEEIAIGEEITMETSGEEVGIQEDHRGTAIDRSTPALVKAPLQAPETHSGGLETEEPPTGRNGEEREGPHQSDTRCLQEEAN